MDKFLSTGTAFFIGVAVLLPKAADFLLLEHQQKWLNQKTKLLFEYVATISFKRIFNWGVSTPVLLIQGTLLTIGAAFMLWMFYLIPAWDWIQSFHGESGWRWPSLGLGALLTIWGVKLTLWVNDALDIPDALLAPQSASAFIGRYVAVLFCAALFLLVPVATVYLPSVLIDHVGGIAFFIIPVGMLLTALLVPLCVWSVIVACALMPAIVVTVCAAFVIFFLLLLRAVLQRLAMYNKGVVAGLVVLVTLILGVMEVVAKLSKY